PLGTAYESSVLGIAGWEGIVTVAVLVSDLAVAAMDDDIGALVAGDGPGELERLGLGLGHSRRALVPVALDCPFRSVGDDVLIPGHGGVHLEACWADSNEENSRATRRNGRDCYQGVDDVSGRPLSHPPRPPPPAV